MRLKMFILLLVGLLSTATPIMAAKFAANDYKYALWLATRFYGAQRSGEGPNWLTYGHKSGDYDGKSFLKDADGDYDLTGSWFDCGDHVMFGQTQFYSAYALLKAYEAFPEGFEDVYSIDYAGYIENNAWDYEDGKPNGIPDVLDEVRYVMDFFMKAAVSENKFYYQVGNGDYDHKHWVTSVHMSTLKIAEGGESNGSRPVLSTSNGAKAMSYEAAAALALFSQLYAKYDPDYAALALEKATTAYKYASKASSSTGGGGYYSAKPTKSINSAAVFSAVEMYKATGDNSYKSDAGKPSLEPQYWALDYANALDLAFYAIEESDATNSSANNKLDETVTTYKGKVDGKGIFNYGNRSWGPMRYNANASFTLALSDKVKGNSSNFDWIRKQIDFILGDNDGNLSYLIGFDRQGVSYPEYPHHRNAYLDDNDKMENCKLSDRGQKLGSLIGGNDNAPSSFKNSISNYEQTEGGVDYNAGLVGALAYIVANMDPNEIPDAVAETETQVENSYLEATPNPFNPSVTLNVHLTSSKAESFKIFNIKGEIVHSFNTANFKKGVNSVTWNGSKLASGIYFARVSSSGNILTKKLILIK